MGGDICILIVSVLSLLRTLSTRDYRLGFSAGIIAYFLIADCTCVCVGRDSEWRETDRQTRQTDSTCSCSRVFVCVEEQSIATTETFVYKNRYMILARRYTV